MQIRLNPAISDHNGSIPDVGGRAATVIGPDHYLWYNNRYENVENNRSQDEANHRCVENNRSMSGGNDRRGRFL